MAPQIHLFKSLFSYGWRGLSATTFQGEGEAIQQWQKKDMCQEPIHVQPWKELLYRSMADSRKWRSEDLNPLCIIMHSYESVWDFLKFDPSPNIPKHQTITSHCLALDTQRQLVPPHLPGPWWTWRPTRWWTCTGGSRGKNISKHQTWSWLSNINLNFYVIGGPVKLTNDYTL